MAISILIENTSNPLVEVGLSIASVTYGGVLFIFIMSLLPGRFNETLVMAGVLAGIAGNILILWLTPLFWVWYVITGCLISFSVSIPLLLINSRHR